MVFYFTGTGNSLYVAKQLDAERISIPQVIHREEQIFKTDTIGIVCPVYGHEMPGMVKDFLKKAFFRTEYFYVVLTYGKLHGCEFLYKSRVMPTSEPLKNLKVPYMARNPVKWGFFRLKLQEIPLLFS